MELARVCSREPRVFHLSQVVLTQRPGQLEECLPFGSTCGVPDSYLPCLGQKHPTCTPVSFGVISRAGDGGMLRTVLRVTWGTCLSEFSLSRFETVSHSNPKCPKTHHVAHTGLEVTTILLLQLPVFWDYSHEFPHLASCQSP